MKAGNESCFDSQAPVTFAGTERGSKSWPIITISFSTFTIPGLLPFTFCKYLGFVYDTSTFPLPRALEHIPHIPAHPKTHHHLNSTCIPAPWFRKACWPSQLWKWNTNSQGFCCSKGSRQAKPWKSMLLNRLRIASQHPMALVQEALATRAVTKTKKTCHQTITEGCSNKESNEMNDTILSKMTSPHNPLGTNKHVLQNGALTQVWIWI